MINIPSYYEFSNPVKVIAGKVAVDNVAYELDQLGAKRPLLITDKGVVAAGLLQIVVDGFAGNDVTIGAVFEDTPPDSSNLVVNSVAKMFREAGCDSLVAVGGGSVLDTAKAVNILVTEGGDDLLQYMGAEIIKKPLKPFIAVPTTAGTGSEVTSVSVVANPDKKIKMAFTSFRLFPNVAILDPRMTLTMPPKITAATGMDALTHAVEAFSCKQKNPLSDAYAVTAIALCRDYLVRAVADGSDKEARFAMANASLLAGVAFTNAMVGVVHSLAHAAGGVCHVPHGVGNAIFLSVGMEYNLDVVADHYAELLLPLAGTDVYLATPPAKRAQKAIDTVKALNRELNRLCGLPLTLKDAGVPRNKLEDIAATAINDGSHTFNPKELEYNDALSLIKKAFD
ncbi:MAG: iron-containing alcohol dehydrogenase [Deltaproteobacteria bacterium]|nr:iron-containing alcohol dehydrogenase [Deltaproteobacteria bacterium]